MIALLLNKRHNAIFCCWLYSLSRKSSAFGGFGSNPRRSQIFPMISSCICSGTGAQRLKWVAQNALPCVDPRSSSASPKDSAMGISALTIIMSSSVVMSSTRPRRFCTVESTALTKSLGTLHSKLKIGSSSLGSLSKKQAHIGRQVMGRIWAGPLCTGSSWTVMSSRFTFKP